LERHRGGDFEVCHVLFFISLFEAAWLDWFKERTNKSNSNLTPEEMLVDQMKEAFSHPFSPNWQDASTQKECDAFDKALGSPEELAEATGSKAHHVRIPGPF
jgi:hypothetical protein